MLLSGCATTTPYFRLDSGLQKDIKVLNGTEYIPLASLCQAYGLDCRWDSFIRTATIERKGKRIVLMAGSERILVGENDRKLDRPVVMEKGLLFVPVSFARNNLNYLAEAPAYGRGPSTAAAKPFTINTIVLDPGHGGKDPGAIGRKLRLKEKDLALAIAKRLESILRENGIRVVMTRRDDTFISLRRRSEIANKSDADLFVSVHINASRTRSQRGFECYYLSDTTDDSARAIEAFENQALEMGEEKVLDNSKNLSTTLWDMTLTENRVESVELARSICGSVEESVPISNKGIKSARFYVLKHSRIPSVLVEVAYLSNRYEEMKLKDLKFLDKVADALAQGILRYKERFESTEGFTKG